MKRLPITLVLTATITPPAGAIKLARTDVQQRLNDYLRALAFYLDELARGTFDRLVFADNSASDVGALRELVAQRGLGAQVEILSFDGLDHPAHYGRGYGEFKLLDYVMQHAQLLQDLPPEAPVWKVTGRYILRNVAAVLASMPPQVELYCHCRNWPQRWVDLYVLGWQHQAYAQFLRGLYTQLREDVAPVSAEYHFRNAVDAAVGRLRIQRRFKVVCVLDGYRGVDNRNYAQDGAKLLLRRWAAKLAPWWWI